MMWITWVTFCVGQVGPIHKLNYLDVTQVIYIHLNMTMVSGKQTNLGCGKCTYKL